MIAPPETRLSSQARRGISAVSHSPAVGIWTQSRHSHAKPAKSKPPAGHPIAPLILVPYCSILWPMKAKRTTCMSLLIFTVLACGATIFLRPLYIHFRWQQTKDHIETLIEQKQYSQSLSLLDYMQKLDASSYWVYETRAWCLSRFTNDSPEIARNADIAISLDPTNALRAYYLRGKMLFDSNGNEAIACFSKIIDATASSTVKCDAYFQRATLYGRGSNYPAAIADTTRALEIYPQQAGTLALRAYLYYCASNYAAANKDFQRATDIEPTNPTVVIVRGVMTNLPPASAIQFNNE